MPMVREYVPDFDEKDIKEAVKLAGGVINQSGRFLSPTSTALVVSSASGINRRSVIYVARTKISSCVLKRLDRYDLQEDEEGSSNGCESGVRSVPDELEEGSSSLYESFVRSLRNHLLRTHLALFSLPDQGSGNPDETDVQQDTSAAEGFRNPPDETDLQQDGSAAEGYRNPPDETDLRDQHPDSLISLDPTLLAPIHPIEVDNGESCASRPQLLW